MYQGAYHGSKKHEPDLDAVLDRAWKNGLDKMMITGGSLEDAHKALEITKKHGILHHSELLKRVMHSQTLWLSRDNSSNR